MISKSQVSASIFTGELDILLLYLRLEPLAWSQTLFGYFKGMENLLRGLVLIFVLPLLKQKLKARDTSVVMGGVMSKVLGLALMGLSTTTWMVFAGEFFRTVDSGLDTAIQTWMEFVGECIQNCGPQLGFCHLNLSDVCR